MDLTLIQAHQTFALAAILIGLVSFGLWTERAKWGELISAPLVILLGGMLLANLNVIPHTSPMFSTMSTFFVPLAIPMLLFRANLKRVLAEAAHVLTAFSVAVGGTLAGAIVGAILMDLGEQESKIVAVLTSSYIGGGANFVAVAQAVEFQNPSQYTAALTADAIGAVVFLALLMALPAIAVIRRLVPSNIMNATQHSNDVTSDRAEKATGVSFDLTGAVTGVALSLLICATGWWLSEILHQSNLFILIITLLALIVANFGQRLVRRVSSEFELGTLFMYLFFAAFGAGADLTAVIQSALPILGFLLILIAVHMVVLLLMGWWLKVDLAELVIASNACILGPATAGALAASRGWRVLVTPGMLLGILGYAIATFIGVSIDELLGG